jgi:penicillin-binding protein 1A
MQKRGVGGRAFDFLTPGHGDHRQAELPVQLCLRSVPEISGGMLAEEVHTGAVLAMQGGFDVIGSSYNRTTRRFGSRDPPSSRSSM